MFLRALIAGEYPGRSMLLVAHDRGRAAPPWLRWRYAGPDMPAAELAAIFRATAPAILYGWVTPLRHLALRPRAWHPTSSCSTHLHDRRGAGRATAGLCADRLGATVSAIYGTWSSVRWRGNAGHTPACTWPRNSTLLEFLPVPGAAGIRRVVATSLPTLGTPLIRYDTGDLAPPPYVAACGLRQPFRAGPAHRRASSSIASAYPRQAGFALSADRGRRDRRRPGSLSDHPGEPEPLRRQGRWPSRRPHRRRGADRWPGALGHSRGQGCRSWSGMGSRPARRPKIPSGRVPHVIVTVSLHANPNNLSRIPTDRRGRGHGLRGPRRAASGQRPSGGYPHRGDAWRRAPRVPSRGDDPSGALLAPPAALQHPSELATWIVPALRLGAGLARRCDYDLIHCHFIVPVASSRRSWRGDSAAAGPDRARLGRSRLQSRPLRSRASADRPWLVADPRIQRRPDRAIGPSRGPARHRDRASDHDHPKPVRAAAR